MKRRTLRVAVGVLAFGLSACGAHVDHHSASIRHSPGTEATIVVFPMKLPEKVKLGAGAEQTLGNLYATELLKIYEILDYDRFVTLLEERKLSPENVFEEETGRRLHEELGLDGVLVSQVYEWEPGTPGILFLAKKGRLGFQARLVDLQSGSVIWSVNQAIRTEPDDSLSVAVSRLCQVLVQEMPRSLAPY